MKVTMILNPRSGKRRAMQVRADARAMAKELGMELHEAVIEGPGDGTRLAAAARAAGHDRVICVGGDGTLNAVAAGLVGGSTSLGLVAMGSGNGYARSQRLPLRPKDALRVAFTGTPALMDVCYLNEQLFLGTAGVGFDARVAHEFDRSKGRGMWNYMRIILKDILQAKPMRVVVKANGETHEAKVLMLVFCNTREFGNGAVISPGSAPDDGLAELRLVSKPALPLLIKTFIQVYTQRADRSRSIQNIVTTEASVHQEGVLAHLDGEPAEVGHELRFRLEPKKLLVVRATTV